MWEPISDLLANSDLIAFIVIAACAFALGFAIGVMWIKAKGPSLGSLKEKKRDEAFFKGIQYILSEDRDHAIEELTKSVKIDSETVETYVALGNLYRSKGDIERAIRIRQSIILRPNIDEEVRVGALFDLGVDYKKAGMVNRALDTFLEVLNKRSSDVRTLIEIERIYEELRDWSKAYETRRRIAKYSKGDHRSIMAHHLVEMGKESQAKGDYARARSLYRKAISTNKGCVDAYLHLGDLYAEKGDYKKAISTWKRIAGVDRRFTFLAYGRLEDAYTNMKNIKPIEGFLRELVEENGDAFTYLALSKFLFAEGDVDGALQEVRKALRVEPHLWEARKFEGEILIQSGRDEDALNAYKELVSHLDLPSLRFQCSNCGLEGDKLYWQCPKCRTWDSTAPISGLRSGTPDTIS